LGRGGAPRGARAAGGGVLGVMGEGMGVLCLLEWMRVEALGLGGHDRGHT
jgi:hypothetical protein